NTAEAQISVGRSDGSVRIVYTAAASPLVWYVLIGRDMRGVMGEVAELLGRAPLPPRWALGFLQSTRHFESTDELRSCPTPSARSASRATGSSICRATGRRGDGIKG